MIRSLYLLCFCAFFNIVPLWAGQGSCHQLAEQLASNHFTLFHKFNLSAKSLLDLHIEWQKLSPDEREAMVPVIKSLPALGRVRISDHRVPVVLQLILQHRGKIDDLLFKAIRTPQALARTEAQALYLLIFRQWWFSKIPGGGVRSLDPLRFNKLKVMGFISRKIGHVLGGHASEDLPSHLLTLLGQNAPLQELFRPNFYLLRYQTLLAQAPVNRRQLAEQLAEELAQIPIEDHLSPRYRELANLRWLLEFQHWPKDVLSELPHPVGRWQHLRSWQQKYTLPFAVTLAELFVLGLIIEKVVIWHLEKEDDELSYSEQLPIIPPPSIQPPGPLLTRTPREELMRQYNDGQITQTQLLERLQKLPPESK